MKKKNQVIFNRDANGEFLYNGLGDHIEAKYKPDTVFDRPWVPYVVMLVCAVVDLVVFITLFQLISFDSPFLLAMQVIGCMIAFDLVPLYGGIQKCRLKQGLTKDKSPFRLSVAVFALAFVMNVVLRILTMKVMTPDTAATSYFGAVSTSDTGTDPATIALTIFAIIIPLVTSLSSYLTTIMTYNPLRQKKHIAEKMIALKSDEIRRLDGYLQEFDEDKDFGRKLMLHDEGKYNEMRKLHHALALSYCTYVRQRLKEHIGDPTATNVLSEESSSVLLKRLAHELNALEGSVDRSAEEALIRTQAEAASTDTEETPPDIEDAPIGAEDGKTDPEIVDDTQHHAA